MVDSDGSVTVDIETIYLGGKEHHVQTAYGSLSVIVYGDQEKPALIAYSDLALNHMSCFRGLFSCPEAASLLLHNFCIYHINPPGHELGAAPIFPIDSAPSAEDMANQILVVLNFFGLGSVMCMGVTTGAYILTLFAMKYRERVLGLILVSPICKAASWTEWFFNKLVSKLLNLYGICGLVKEFLIQMYFSKEVRVDSEVPESDMVQACRRLLDEKQSVNMIRSHHKIDQRLDITDGLKNLKSRTLIFVGDQSPFHSEAIHMASKMDPRYCALVENSNSLQNFFPHKVQACGSMVTEEQPHAMLIPLEYFLMGFGIYKPSVSTKSPRSPLAPSYISPELFSPQSMGLRLKPIKTRVSA